MVDADTAEMAQCNAFRMHTSMSEAFMSDADTAECPDAMLSGCKA
jgi:hypothetical protein